MSKITVDHHPDEDDRVTVRAFGIGDRAIVVDVIANDDGSVHVEAYAYRSTREDGGRQQASVVRKQVNSYETRSPNLTLRLTDDAIEIPYWGCDRCGATLTRTNRVAIAAHRATH